MEEALPAQQALVASTTESSQRASESAETQHGTGFLVATLLVAELAWLSIIGFSLRLLLA